MLPTGVGAPPRKFFAQRHGCTDDDRAPEGYCSVSAIKVRRARIGGWSVLSVLLDAMISHTPLAEKYEACA